MKPVMQTLFNTTNGNCFQACVASIMELPLTNVPNFMDFNDDKGHWWREFGAWLRRRNMFHYSVELAEPNRGEWADWLEDKQLIYLGSIKSGGVHHALVLKGTNVIHDPWPNNAKFTFDDIVDIQFFLCIDPSKCGVIDVS